MKSQPESSSDVDNIKRWASDIVDMLDIDKTYPTKTLEIGLALLIGSILGIGLSIHSSNRSINKRLDELETEIQNKGGKENE